MQRKWLVEDNLVSLYIAKHKYKDLKYESEEIEKIISHAGFDMRVENFNFIVTGKGLSAGGPAESWKQLYSIFKDFNQKKFAELVNLILEVKLKVNMNKDETNQNDSQKGKSLTEEQKAALKKVIVALKKQKTREQEIRDFVNYILNNP